MRSWPFRGRRHGQAHGVLYTVLSRFSGPDGGGSHRRGDHRSRTVGEPPVSRPDALLALVLVTALAFDFTNGFHDTANAMATSIATGALRPRVAVAVAGVFNLVGAFLSVRVAETVSGGLVDDAQVSLMMIFAGLTGGILWNVFTWFLGLPSSSTHALLGGLIGAVWVGAGESAVFFGAVFGKVILPALLSPVVGCLLALAGICLVRLVVRDPDRGPAARAFRIGQIGSASLVALAHGTNDAQKTMGVMTLALISGGVLAHGSPPPLWVVLTAGAAIALGTYCGGWRIIRTMGTRLTDIRPAQGFVAETAATAVILGSSRLGFPLSTTQVCSGSILGVGLVRGLSAVRWRIAGRIALSWVLTLPSAAAIGGGCAAVAGRGVPGVALVAAATVTATVWLAHRARRRPVTPDNVNDPFG
ncbi:inorganic phosphate transporter [Streptomyces clavuligerus]|uniref:Phosphate transporter n=1 Tax=Streptomyces clavuligerus TaxID=1901 RepID=B5GTM0_STRCL|nr:inorganic phosphate transporter [Streptomyces clavuligerus]EDY49666.1 low-affinity inorganic phosphate permease [Streptomyces clavuligerus]EFG04087.1 Low-affinity inorganic phosphate transporter [Streptomyces clavuligerus]MBY6307426.1 inorganic phosphate transporter [Streptomyces clavuligerus]QCS10015.1 inorganic phosphate transporter [Streptomyces clavuligerus]QPJ97941.1 inorganic phosphate transporter [Streptomyces clavuligerus]